MMTIGIVCNLCQEKYQFTTNIFDRIYILMWLFKET